MPPSNLLRLGGLAAALGGLLLAIVYLIALFVNLSSAGGGQFGPVASNAFYLQYALGVPGRALLALGLVGLYSRHTEATGTIGFIGFLMAFVGMFFASGVLWAALLADLGWALFGVACIRARVYQPVATVLLVVGAIVSDVAGVLAGNPGSILMDAGVGAEGIFNAVMYAGVGGKIVLNVAIAWLGLALFTNWSQVPQQPKHAT